MAGSPDKGPPERHLVTTGAWEPAQELSPCSAIDAASRSASQEAPKLRGLCGAEECADPASFVSSCGWEPLQTTPRLLMRRTRFPVRRNGSANRESHGVMAEFDGRGAMSGRRHRPGSAGSAARRGAVRGAHTDSSATGGGCAAGPFWGLAATIMGAVSPLGGPSTAPGSESPVVPPLGTQPTRLADRAEPQSAKLTPAGHPQLENFTATLTPRPAWQPHQSCRGNVKHLQHIG